ncbi:hypothetical protein BYT27DRAFT_7211909 [Phlegmacium glaucopus]|nr:hypothetical protein BYT27DRAFT_7211909 [Phlegmacium glaucopus]
MAAPTRAVVVDNNDSRIKYTQSWVSRQSFGPAVFPTLHMTTNGSLQLDFTGTQVALFGVARIIQPTWTCSVDGAAITPSPSTLPDDSFCQVQDLDDKPHTLTLNITPSSYPWVPFGLDYISYTPSKSPPLDTSFIRVSNVDPDIRYSSGWMPLEDVYNTTSTPGSLSFGPHSVQVTYNGSQLSTPLTFAFMLVQGGAPSSQTHTNVIIGAIVGGSVAATIALILIVFLFIRFRRQRRKTTKSKTFRPSFSRTVFIETDRASAISTQGFLESLPPSIGHGPHDLAPSHYNDIKSQPFYNLGNSNYDELDDKSSYCGGYQTCGQVKAIEAQAFRSDFSKQEVQILYHI